MPFWRCLDFPVRDEKYASKITFIAEKIRNLIYKSSGRTVGINVF